MSADNSRILTATYANDRDNPNFNGKTAHLWDGKSGALLGGFGNGTPLLDAMALSHDGRVVACSYAWTGQILCWNADSGKLLWSYQFPGRGLYNAGQGAANSLKFSPDDKTLLAGTSDGLILYGAKDGSQITKFSTNLPCGGGIVAWSKDGKLVADVSCGDICLWSVSDSKIVASFKTELGSPAEVDFSSDGTRLVIADEMREAVAVYEIPQGRQLFKVVAETRSVAFVSTTDEVLIGSQNGLRLLDAKDGACIKDVIPKE